MFKRIKENPFVLKFKEMWADPKTCSIIKLGLWFVFFAVAVLIVKLSTPSYTAPSSNGDGLGDMKSYDFTYQTSDLLINGQYYEGNLVFYKDNYRYYYNGNTYLINGDKAILEDFSLDILKLSSSMLNNLISGINGVNGNGFKQYSVPLDRFINLYDGCTDVDLSKAMSYNVVVTVYSDDKVMIDLTNYMLYKTGISTNYLVNIYYYNVNNVSDFSKDFEKMIGVVR